MQAEREMAQTACLKSKGKKLFEKTLIEGLELAETLTEKNGQGNI